MKQNIKRFLSLIIVFTMMFSAVSSSFAEGLKVDESTAELDKTEVTAGETLTLKVHLADFKPSTGSLGGPPISICTVRMYKDGDIVTKDGRRPWSAAIWKKDVSPSGDGELEIEIPEDLEAGEYELNAQLFGSEGDPIIELPFKVIENSMAVRIDFSEDINKDEIDNDVVEWFYIGPQGIYGEFLRDAKLEVKLNGKRIEPSDINSGSYGNSRHIFTNVVFDKYDNVFEIKAFDSDSNPYKIRDENGNNVDTLIKHVINTNKPKDDEEPLEIRKAVYHDTNKDGKIGQGDKLVITFNKEINVSEELGTNELFNGGNINLTDKIKIDGYDLTIEVADSPNANFYEIENCIKAGMNIDSITDLKGNSVKIPKNGVKVQVPKADKLKITEAVVVKEKGNINDKFEVGDKIVFEINRPVHGLKEMVPANFVLYKENEICGHHGDVNKTVDIDNSGKIITLTVSKLDKDWLKSKIEDFKTFSVEKTEDSSAFADVYGNVLDTSETKGVELQFKDKEAPKIEVEGLKDGEKVSIQDIKFKVTVTDNVDIDIKPIVKLNEEIITGTNGEYKVVLKEGENIITIEATDKAGNKSDIKYKLIYKVKTKEEIVAEIEQVLPDAVGYATVNNYSNDWVTAGLGRLEDYKDRISSNYLEDTAVTVKGLAAQQDKGGNFKVTDFQRITMGVNAAGGDPTDIDGINMIERIYNPRKKGKKDYITRQGLNAVIWGLIAVDSGSYNIPDDAEWNRDRFIQEILDNECHNKDHFILQGKKGGWQYGGNRLIDPDMTGMAMIALAPYNNDQYPEVQAAINRAVRNLSLIQREDGGYASWGTINSESCVQVIMGLCANNVDPTGKEFTKKGGNVVDALLRFKVEGTGFAHAPMGGELKPNGMANEQALYGLSQLCYYLNENEGSIFKWEDKDAPIITTLNLENKTIEEEILEFKVTAEDYEDGEVEPIVKLNEKVIKGTNGEYKAKLKEGENIILLRVVDKAGNEREETYEIVYEKEVITIEGIEVVKDIEVDFNTNKEDVLAKLPEKVTLNLSNGNKEEVDVTWTSEKYDGNKPGEYISLGNYELPEDVTGEKPEVKVKVIVKEQNYIDIKDPNLKKAINNALLNWQDPDAEITKEQMESLTYLSISSRKNPIESLEGIQYAINLEKIEFIDSFVKNLKPLEDLTSLKSLNFTNNEISDIRPIEKLTNLEELYFSDNNVKDIRPIEKLTKLKKLSFGGTSINSIESVSELNSLEELYLRNSKVNDITPIKELLNLTKLQINNNEIEDISLIAKLEKISFLDISDNEITDINVLNKLEELTFLDISKNKIKDINTIKNLDKLKYFYFYNNKVSDINYIKELEKLSYIDGKENNILLSPSTPEFLNPFRDSQGHVIPVVETNNIKNNGDKVKLVDIEEAQKIETEWQNNNDIDKFKGKFSGKIIIDTNQIREKEVIVTNINKVEDIEVAFDTDKEDVLSKLPKKVTLELSNGNKEEVDVTWTSEKYDGNKSGDYIFIGSYELPKGVTGDKPEVKVKVTVKEEVKPEPTPIPIPEIDKTKLEGAINKGEEVDIEDKTKESVKTLEEAIAKGKEVLEIEEVTQEELDNVAKAIEDAIEDLEIEEKPIEPTKPQKPSKPDKLEKPNKPQRPGKPGPGKPGKIDKQDKPGKVDKPIEYDKTRKPSKTILPKTGEASNGRISILGILLLVIGAGLWINKKKQNEA